MARKKVSTNSEKEVTAIPVPETRESKPREVPEAAKEKLTPAKPTPVASTAPKPKVLLLTFDRWFATTGRPMHHKAGMKAYVNVTGKRPKEFWDQLFAQY